MKDQEYDITSIRNYLLGSVSESETETFDELSVSDDEFAELLRSVDNDLVDAYVHDELSASERAEFEKRYLASPLRSEKIRIAKALKDFIEVRNRDAPYRSPIVVEDGQRRPFWEILFGPILQWGLAAAALVLAIGAVWLWNDNRQLKRQIDETASLSNVSEQRLADLERQLESLRSAGNQANLDVAAATEERDRLQQELDQTRTTAEQAEKQNAERQRLSAGSLSGITASFVLTPSLRGSNQLQRVSIPTNAGRVVLRLELEPNDFTAYRAALKEPDSGKIVWQSGSQKASKRGQASSLAVSFPARLLSAKVYTISLTGIAADRSKQSFSDYTFQVVR